MAETISILTTKSSDSTYITIADATDWSLVTGTIDSLTSIVINIYTSTTESADETYTFSAEEVTEYVSNGEIDLTMLDLFGTQFAEDNWYIIQMTANDSDYVSNYDGFGSHVNIENAFYIKYINGLNTPERDIYTMQPIHFQKMMLDGLNRLDDSNIISRDVKYKKRLSALTKQLL